MDAAITINQILSVMGVIVAAGAFFGVCAALYKSITNNHDRAQKWDDYDRQISDVNNKIQDVRDEQCMMTYCMMATLDGLHQLGCNGKVTKAREDLSKYMNKSAHGVER